MPNKQKVPIGVKYGRITILKDVGYIDRKRIILGICDCGAKKEFNLYALQNGSCISCGCYQLEKAAIAGITHGLTKHPLHVVWRMMSRRCYKPKATSYNQYGGRGITICDEWRNDFKAFYDWAMANGWEKGLQIDRKDNDGHYDPGNCRVVTKKTNTRNRECTWFIEYNGEKKPLGEWCEIFKIPYNNANARIRKGWPLEKVFNTRIKMP